jgi:hypothetical protein
MMKIRLLASLSFVDCLIAGLAVSAGVAAQSSSPGAPLEQYGSGTASNVHGTPRLWPNGMPSLGKAGFALQHANGRPFSFAVTVVGQPTNQTLAGLSLLVDPQQGDVLGARLLDANGRASSGIALPSTPALAGAEFYAQSFVLDPQSSAAIGITSSRGLRFRLQLPPRLVVGTDGFLTPNDPLLVIDLETGLVRSRPTPLDYISHVALTRAGNQAFALDLGRLARFDVDGTGGPTALAPLAQQPGASVGPTRVIRLSPNGRELWIGISGSLTQPAQLEIWDADPVSPTFGTFRALVPVGGLTTWDLNFSPSGALAYAISGGATLREIDNNPSSSTYRTVLRELALSAPGSISLSFGFSIDPRGQQAQVGLLNSGPASTSGSLALVDLTTMTRIDCDTQTPGVNDLPLTTASLGFPYAIDGDLLGRETYVVETTPTAPAGAALLTAFVTDRSDPQFGSRRSVPLPQPGNLVASPAGDLVYVTQGVYGGSPSLIEVRTDTWQVRRQWTFPANLQLLWPALR